MERERGVGRRGTNLASCEPRYFAKLNPAQTQDRLACSLSVEIMDLFLDKMFTKYSKFTEK